MPDVCLSKKEIQLTLESLLYCASSDFDHSQYCEDLIEISQLAIRLRLLHQEIPESNITFVKENPFTSQFTHELLKFFPEIQII